MSNRAWNSEMARPARRARGVRYGILSAAVVLAAAAGAAAGQTQPPFLPKQVQSSTVPADGDLNPYGVATVPQGFPSGGKIKPGDVLVSNFNNSNNQQGTGTTIVQLTPNGIVAPSGAAKTFFQGSGLGLTTALGVLRAGFVVVGNVPTTDGKIGTIKPGSLLFLDRNGKIVATLDATDPANKLDGPWDLTIDDEGSQARIFVSNVLNGTVTRLDLAVTASGVSVGGTTVIAGGYMVQPNASALILGPTGLAYDAADDVLFVASTADNKIFAVPQAGTRKDSAGTGAVVFKNKHLRGPLALVFAPNGDLLTANGDAVNGDPKQPSEIVEFTPAGRFVRQFDVDAAQGGAFGMAVSAASPFDPPASTVVFAYIDDVTNTLTVNIQNLAQQP